MTKIYSATSVYLQLSRTEGNPMVLGEAMLSGCIPVVSRVGGMPDTVGTTGFLVDSPEPDGIIRAVQQALELGSDPQQGPSARSRARRRIVDAFPIKRREEDLIAILAEVAKAALRRSRGEKPRPL